MAGRSERFGLGRYFGPPPGKPTKSGVRKVINYLRDSVVNQPKDKVTRVINVNHNLYLNSLDHHTDKYEPRYFAVRRGQTFDLDIELSQEYNVKRDDIRLVFQFGIFPLISKGTDIELYLSTEEAFRNWNATVVSKDGNTIKVRVITPSDCYVGKWTLQVHTVVIDGGYINVHKYNHEPKIYVLFNPWCKDDMVYMEEDDRKEEYVLNDTGIVYKGSGYWPNPTPWNFAQFEDVVLDCAMYLLDERSYMKDTVRGNPINVTRKISALVNSQDDFGVLAGNWSGDYTGGRSPLAWSGSEAILEEYYRDKEPVKYGQCWVFSAVVTSLCRTLGIPCRSVTNYDSAHDTDGSTTIDVYKDQNGVSLEHMNSDSVWNFHVWNDVWMTRPDLPEGYGGWQAIDATPQGTSGGVYCMGPMSLKAIKEGEITLPFDGAFVFAEVNGDKLEWEVMYDGSMKIDKSYEDWVGTCLATKKVGENEMENVTYEYKHQEYGNRRRAAVKKANLRGIGHAVVDIDNRINEKRIKDVTATLPTERTEVGEPLMVTMAIKNFSTEKRNVKGKLHIVSQFYTGIVYHHIDTIVVNVELQPGNVETIVTVIPPETYYQHLPDHCPIRINCFVRVKETDHTISTQRQLHLRKPSLTITAPENCKVGEKVNVEVSFTSKLDQPLTDCELCVEGPGLQKALRLQIKENVPALGTFNRKFDITPAKSGTRELIVNFNSYQLLSINASHRFIVKE